MSPEIYNFSFNMILVRIITIKGFSMKHQYTNLLSSSIFDNAELEEKYNHSIQYVRRIQIRYITILTGILYIIYSQIDKLVLPNDISQIANMLHLYITAPILFMISIMSFFPKLYTKMIYILVAAPIFATVSNLILVINIESFTTYLTEIYLIIFWVFTVSGLRLAMASFSVFVIFCITIISTYFIFPLPKELFIMHGFWMVSVISFGFLNASLLEKLSKRNFLNNEKLQNLAITDNLTGLANRNRLDEILQNELERCARFNHSFGFVMLDIDHFKCVNDEYGHQIGDDILVSIANIIKENTRATDILVRWGGEEFALVCLETNKEGILSLVENIRQKVQNHVFEKVGSKTISIGITLSTKEDTIFSVIKRADEALYKAKHNGRNRVEFS